MSWELSTQNCVHRISMPIPTQKKESSIIGLIVGEAHIEGCQKYPGCEIVALCKFFHTTNSIRQKGNILIKSYK